MTPAALALAEAERRLLARCQELEQHLDAGEDAAWPQYVAAVAALNALVPAERRPLATTAEMAERLGVAPKTVRKLGRAGKLEGVRFGQRGRGAIRWRSA
jgi:excisionase family DNA binding protein